MKRIVLPLILLFSLVGFSQTVLVDDTQTLDQLINDVLVSGSCASAQNITSPNNAMVAGEGFNSYGYFERGTSNFPFEEGIVLLSGDIGDVPLGPVSDGGNPPWDGDADLDALSGG
ncbi:MAG: hypothetical protein HKM28_07920, partial [Flavobacteriaceae bacterium]|nr:hypothetical protein [Flavobacteriaceae bacterium]